MNDFKIRKADARDLEPVLRLLSLASLPTDGVLEHFPSFFVAQRSDQVVGCIGLEIYERAALLRSLAVARELQKQGLGSRLVKHCLQEAAGLELDEVFLLTTTAAGFFRRFGFVKITREEALAKIRQSVEFQINCCETAVCMRLCLKP